MWAAEGVGECDGSLQYSDAAIETTLALHYVEGSLISIFGMLDVAFFPITRRSRDVANGSAGATSCTP
jgi:hypothetical protein